MATPINPGPRAKLDVIDSSVGALGLVQSATKGLWPSRSLSPPAILLCLWAGSSVRGDTRSLISQLLAGSGGAAARLSNLQVHFLPLFLVRAASACGQQSVLLGVGMPVSVELTVCGERAVPQSCLWQRLA